jgi:hypothetical protein
MTNAKPTEVAVSPKETPRAGGASGSWSTFQSVPPIGEFVQSRIANTSVVQNAIWMATSHAAPTPAPMTPDAEEPSDSSTPTTISATIAGTKLISVMVSRRQTAKYGGPISRVGRCE